MATSQPTNERQTFSRRMLLASGAATIGAAALAACTNEDKASATTDLTVVRVDEVPATDPGSDVWSHAHAAKVEMDGQLIALPNRAVPSVPTITVRAVHDNSSIGFRIDWKDPDASDSTVALDQFRDACAVLLAPGAGDAGLRMMGSATQAATLLHWKADQQYDMEHGRQLIRDHAPNISVDYYAPLKDNLTPTIEDYKTHNAGQWLPGNYAGNPLSAAEFRSPVEKLLAKGYGTAATAKNQDALGAGVRHGDGWRVVIARPLGATDDGEVDLKPGSTYTAAFAVWTGAQRDVGSRKSPSKSVLSLNLES